MLYLEEIVSLLLPKDKINIESKDPPAFVRP